MQPRISFLCVKDTLLVYVQLVIHQYPQTLFCKATEPEAQFLTGVFFQRFILVQELKEKYLLDIGGLRERTIHTMKCKWKHNKEKNYLQTLERANKGERNCLY